MCSFTLCKNDIVNRKVVLIFMLCQIFDFSEASMGKEKKGIILNLKVHDLRKKIVDRSDI